jgi:AcrR family transcriptional regulator
MPIARIPQQDRSRASFERVLDAAAKLIEEKGYSGFTLGDVVKRAKVSIGSIYGRVDSKDELIRAVRQRVISKMELEQADMVVRIRRRALTLRDLITVMIKELASFLSVNAAVLNSFIERAPADARVEGFRRQAYGHTLLDFKLLLLERRSEIAQRDAAHAAEVCFDVVYSSLARFFDVGSISGSATYGNLEQRIADLSAVCLAYLTGPRATRAAGRRRAARQGSAR